MSAVPNRQPYNDDESQPQEFPLTDAAELLVKAMGVETKRLLSKQHIQELQRRGKGIREGYLHIKIHEGRVVGIADTRWHLFDLNE